MAEIKTPQELKELQAWVKKAKKTPDVRLFASSFKSVYYTFDTGIRSQGSGKRIGTKVNKVHYTSFMFYGVEVMMPNPHYEFPEADFDSKRLWIDARIKYGGYIHSPKREMTEFGGINLEQAFLDLLKKDGYYVFEKGHYGKKTYYLCSRDESARKVSRGQRLNFHDTANRAVVKIDKKELEYFTSKFPLKTEEDIRLVRQDNGSWL